MRDEKITELLKKSGYSEKAIEYFIKKINVDYLKEPDVYFSYTGPCGDTLEIYLKIKENKIEDAKFQATGCAGAFVSGSALCNLIKDKTLEEAEKIRIEDIITYLNGLPKAKIHCACLAKTTLEKAIQKYKKDKINNTETKTEEISR